MISVIITTYKRPPEVVKRALGSVLNQSYSNIEIIVIDDSPSDYEYREIISNYISTIDDSRVIYHQHSTNRGACAARNTGISISKGEYVAFLDDDDEWLPRKLEKQISGFSNIEIGIVYCDHYLIDEVSNKKIRVSHQIDFKEKNITLTLLKNNFIGSTSFPLVRRECFKKCGLFDEELLSSQDLEMWIRITKIYNLKYIPVPLVNYFVHEGEQITSSMDKKIQAVEKINHDYHDELKKEPLVHSHRILKLSSYYAKDREIKVSLSLWLKAVIIYPFNVKKISKVFLKNILLYNRYI